MSSSVSDSALEENKKIEMITILEAYLLHSLLWLVAHSSPTTEGGKIALRAVVWVLVLTEVMLRSRK